MKRILGVTLLALALGTAGCASMGKSCGCGGKAEACGCGKAESCGCQGKEGHSDCKDGKCGMKSEGTSK